MADPSVLCGTCPLIGIFLLTVSSSVPQTHIPQGTCPECSREKVSQGEDWDIAACCIQQSPSSTSSWLNPSNLPSKTSVNSLEKKSAKSLNVLAIGIGVTGAVLLLVVCAAIFIYLKRRRRKRKLPPSAEFMDAAALWKPRMYYGMASPTSSTLTPPNEVASFGSSPFQPLRYSAPAVPYSPTPTTPSFSS